MSKGADDMANIRLNDACNCFAARKASRLVTKLYEDHLKPARLTSTQFALLSHLDEVTQASVSELAEAMAMERTSLVRALKPLERDGLAVQSPDRQDPRRNMVGLTAAGQGRLQEAIPLWQAAQAEFERKCGLVLPQLIRESVRTM